MVDWRKDGVDHVNIFSRGQTDLGRWLSPFTPIPEGGYIVIDGERFLTVEGYSQWVIHRDHRFKELNGVSARILGNLLDASYWPIDFRVKVEKALDLKYESSMMIREALEKNTLPLEMYVVFNKAIVVTGPQFVLDYWRDKNEETT